MVFSGLICLCVRVCLAMQVHPDLQQPFMYTVEDGKGRCVPRNSTQHRCLMPSSPRVTPSFALCVYVTVLSRSYQDVPLLAGGEKMIVTDQVDTVVKAESHRLHC